MGLQVKRLAGPTRDENSAMTRYEAYVEKDWKKLGLANVVMVRVRDDGSADFAMFLVDLFCLGVKDVISESGVTEQSVQELVNERLPEDFRERLHPACAKKMIEGAIAYAELLGFAPHRDFRKARKVLAGLDAAVCPTDFTYGEDGKPCYVRGANDDEARVEKILARLEARCGPDGFTYVDPGDDEEEDEYLAVREELMEWLDNEDPSVPRFYEVSGLITGLLLCPRVTGPLKVLDVIWGPEGRVWQDHDEAQEFADLLMAYWNQVNDLIHACLAPEAPPGAHPVDVWAEDFAEDDGIQMTAAMFDWAIGFQQATQIEPEAWSGSLARPDLAPHWEVIRWWADLDLKENREAMIAAAESTPPRTITGAVTALARAFRPEAPAD
jgi:yecA family protein